MAGGRLKFCRQAVSDLLEFAENEFRLSHTPKGAKSTIRQQLIQVRSVRGITDPMLSRSENKPRAYYYLWEWFCDLYGGDRISFQEIKAWLDITRNELTQFELSVIKQLNSKALTAT